MEKALIIIDIQNEYFENGALELVNPISASENAAKILEFFRKHNLPVIHVQHISPEGVPFFVKETEGVKIHENVQPLNDEKLIQKSYPNSFRETDLLEHLKNLKVKDLVIVGMMTHMCIDATTRAAFDHSFACTVIADACATRDLDFSGKTVKAEDVQNAFLSALAFSYAKVDTCAEYLKNNNK